jgi:hypothetical protein
MRPADFQDSDLHCLVTGAVRAVAATRVTSHIERGELRLAATRHVLAAVASGERNRARLEDSTLAHILPVSVVTRACIVAERLPWAHRSST